ncbi:MAG: hypothetical protein IKU42_00145 [Oscillospiraceae bacterium]|nr:hypothetical protein [Oscillospiraceae bacterium]
MEHSFLATLCAIVITGAAVFAAMAIPEKTEEPKIPEETAVFVSEEPKTMVLGAFEGKLALFIGESPYPNRIFDFFIRNLPPEDQNLLSEGIVVSSEKELELLLEDFMS